MFRSCLTSTALALVTAAALGGQDRPRHARAGFWLAGGAGVATNDLKCTGCTFTGPRDAWRGGSGGGASFAAGGTLSQQLLLGVELSPSGTADSTRTATMFLLLLVAQYYPLAFEGFHLKGGIGPVSILLGDRGGSVEGRGFAVQGGVGYDFRIGRSFGLTPYANIAATKVARGIMVFGNATSVTRLQNSRIAQLGLALRWY